MSFAVLLPFVTPARCCADLGGDRLCYGEEAARWGTGDG